MKFTHDNLVALQGNWLWMLGQHLAVHIQRQVFKDHRPPLQAPPRTRGLHPRVVIQVAYNKGYLLTLIFCYFNNSYKYASA